MKLDARPKKFTLLHLSMVDIGPLRGANEISFISKKDGEPCNLFMIMGPNGSGKTTVLDIIHYLVALLGGTPSSELANSAPDIIAGDGTAQLDLRVELDDGQNSEAIILSIVAGQAGLLKVWSEDERARILTKRQSVIHFRGDIVAKAEDDAERISRAVTAQVGTSPLSLFDSSTSLPTVLYFPSERYLSPTPNNRRVIERPPHYGYQSAQRFGRADRYWDVSIDTMFGWLAWINEELEQDARSLINDFVFRGQNKRLEPFDRHELRVPVYADGQTHWIDRLSQGERHLINFVLRIAVHKTGSTIVLIDEVEQHLHLVMRRRLINLMKQWARDDEHNITFIMTSHQVDVPRVLAPKQAEDGLIKGGIIFRNKALFEK